MPVLTGFVKKTRGGIEYGPKKKEKQSLQKEELFVCGIDWNPVKTVLNARFIQGDKLDFL